MDQAIEALILGMRLRILRVFREHWRNLVDFKFTIKIEQQLEADRDRSDVARDIGSCFAL